MKFSRRSVFLLMAALYFALLLAVPAYLVIHHYDVLRSGRFFRIAVEPYDPYDPFRGRYVQIQDSGIHWEGYGPYALLYENAEGFVQTAICREEPPEDRKLPYVKNLEISRYYLNEKKAPQVERLQRRLPEDQIMYVIVAVKNGSYVIEGMYINEIPIEEYIEEYAE